MLFWLNNIYIIKKKFTLTKQISLEFIVLKKPKKTNLQPHLRTLNEKPESLYLINIIRFSVKF